MLWRGNSRDHAVERQLTAITGAAIPYRRNQARPLSYSQGIHRCLGVTLGGTEITTLLPVLLGALGPWRFADSPVSANPARPSAAS